MKLSMKHVQGIALVIIICICCGSCVSIKPSTVQLSAQVGERQAEMEKLHQLALQRYFDMEVKKVEEFLTNTWEPLFLKNFLGTSQVLQMLQNVSKIDDKGKNIIKEAISFYLTDKSEAERAASDIVSKISETRKGEDGAIRTVLTRYVENKKLDGAVIHISSLLGTDEPARIIFDFTAAAHKEMQAQRKEMLAPVEQARAEAMASLSAAYAELIRGQGIITGRLEAAAKRSAQQDELMNVLKLKISDDLVNKMSDFSKKVNDALGKANEAINKNEGMEKVGEAIREGLR